MRDGWPIKQAAAVLGIHPNKVPQSIQPAFLKVARLLVANPVFTWRELGSAIEHVTREQDEVEFDLRAAALDGRFSLPRNGRRL